MKVYKVGGAVRDRLLGRPVTDVDWVVVGATPEDLLKLGYRQVGRDFPVFLHPETKEEYALARRERKIAPGYAGFSFDTTPEVTLEEDLQRRDLTINAMAEDESGRLIDPFGGERDLRSGTLRHVSPAFAEDPVRILRVARFAARYDYTVAPETLQLMRDMVGNGEVAALVPERVWAELARALEEPHPRRFVEVLRACGALAVLFPELDRLFGVPQPAQHHPEIDTGEHCLLVLDRAVEISGDARVRFAALMHDLGKGTTPPDEWPRHIGHEARGVKLIEALATRYRIPKDFRDLAVLVARYHCVCHRAQELRPATLLDMLMTMDALRRPDRLELFLAACTADARGRLGHEGREYPQADIVRQALEAARSVDTAPLVAAGLEGEQLGKRLRELRIQAIAERLGR